MTRPTRPVRPKSAIEECIEDATDYPEGIVAQARKELRALMALARACDPWINSVSAKVTPEGRAVVRLRRLGLLPTPARGKGAR